MCYHFIEKKTNKRITPAFQIEEGSRNVRLGTLIAVMVEEGQDWRQVEIPSPSAPPPATHETIATAASPPASSPAPPPKTVPVGS